MVRKHEYDCCCPCVECRKHFGLHTGIETERARVRKVLNQVRYAHGVAILPTSAISELLGGEAEGEAG